MFDPKRISIKKDILDDSKLSVYPNPFTDRFELELESEERGLLTISIIGMDGRTIRSESMQMESPGIRWTVSDGANLLTGTYILRLQLNDEGISRKLIRR